MLMLCAGRAMPEQSIIAWDLETIPDLPAAARMLDLGAGTETEVREALKAFLSTPSTRSSASALWSRAASLRVGAWTLWGHLTSASGAKPN